MRMFICKVASRCNLDCDYCYVYRHADQTWRNQPVKMSLDTAAQFGRRIDEHARRHGLTRVDVVMHGGEPFLIGLDYMQQLCTIISEHALNTQIQFRTQTNGTFFDKATLEFCIKWNMTVGLSLDGPRHVNDVHRLDHHGHSSFADVERGLTLLSSREGRPIWSGFLTVIDLRHNPLDVYEYLRSFTPRSIEFLLPLGHYELRPPGKEVSLDTTLYADWLLPIFHRWYEERPQPITIRRFRDVIALLAGLNNSSEEWGLQPIDFAVIETNGEIQAVDTLKITYPGANHLGLDIFRHSFDDMFSAPSVVERQLRWSSICTTCQSCSLVKVCGGGYFPHRYSHANGFQNPSIYCADIMKLIREIHVCVSADVRRLRERQMAGRV